MSEPEPVTMSAPKPQTKNRKSSSQFGSPDERVRKDQAPDRALPNCYNSYHSSENVGKLPRQDDERMLIRELFPKAKFENLLPHHYFLYQLCCIEEEDSSLHRAEEDLLNWFTKHFPEFNDYEYKHQLNKKFFSHINNDGIPLLLCEVHSSRSYSSEIQNLTSCLVYQLRFLRLCSADIEGVSGFVFPNHKEKKLVTKVRVNWFELAFRSELTLLEQESVFDEVQKVLKSQCCFAELTFPKDVDYFLHLSDDELSDLENKLSCTSALVQVRSKFAILVKDDEYYYKILPTSSEGLVLLRLMSLALKKLNSNPSSIRHLTLPIDVVNVYAANAFKFESHPYHFDSYDQVKDCLATFVTEAVFALKELHEMGYAHTDVRLPNFCISKDYELKLIDFDRAMHVLRPYFNSKDSFLYMSPKTNALPLDYRQLGLLILRIQVPASIDSVSPVNLEEERPFLSKMIFEGEYDEKLFDDWKQDPEVGKLSFEEVFNASFQFKAD